MAGDRRHAVRIARPSTRPAQDRITVAFDDEYRALHTGAVWMDRSPRDARLEVRGPDRIEWLHGLLTQDVATLAPDRG
jgi:glycine cleavage system aminomethyltransferase T